MAEKFKAKNVEIYLAQVDDTASFDPSSRGNDKTLLAYVDDEVGLADVSRWTKVTSDDKINEFSVEPSDDSTETKNYYGVDSSGAQNSDTETTPNSEVNIKLTADITFDQVLEGFVLDQDSITHSSYSDYESYNLGNKTSNTLLMFVRVKRLVGSTYNFKNYLIVNPQFLNPGSVGGSSEDSSLTTDYNLVGNATKIWKDFYSSASDETVSNITL